MALDADTAPNAEDVVLDAKVLDAPAVGRADGRTDAHISRGGNRHSYIAGTYGMRDSDGWGFGDATSHRLIAHAVME